MKRIRELREKKINEKVSKMRGAKNV